MKRSARTGLSRAAFLVAVNGAVLLLLLALLEGGSSAVLFARDVWRTPALAERLHTKYDPELGWVSLPRVRLPNMYGPGIGLTTNTRGFRGSREITDSVPAGLRRVVCSGDSFTLGYGVANELTWCRRLEDAGDIQSVNMGQGGYGLDQAYLWYRRDGAPLQHHVHILAFITDDLRRMRHESFLGYPKPVLVPDADSIRVTHVPVPRRPLIRSWFIRHRAAIQTLRMTQLATRLAGTSSGERRNPAVLDVEEARRVAAYLLKDLASMHARSDRRFLIVHLPTEYELRGEAPVEWQQFFRETATTLGVEFIDLFPAFRALPDSTMSKIFLQPGDVQFASAAGHLTALGNDMVARLLRPYLSDTGE